MSVWRFSSFRNLLNSKVMCVENLRWHRYLPFLSREQVERRTPWNPLHQLLSPSAWHPLLFLWYCRNPPAKSFLKSERIPTYTFLIKPVGRSFIYEPFLVLWKMRAMLIWPFMNAANTRYHSPLVGHIQGCTTRSFCHQLKHIACAGTWTLATSGHCQECARHRSHYKVCYIT